MHQRHQRGHAYRQAGFTLIELLVVVAIMGLLASIILASLSNARSRGADATGQQNLDNIRTQSELYYSTQTPNGYTLNGATIAAATTPAYTNCSTANTLLVDPNVAAEITSMIHAEGVNTVACAYTANLAAWMVDVSEQTGGYWCLDSTGREVQEASAPTGTSCP